MICQLDALMFTEEKWQKAGFTMVSKLDTVRTTTGDLHMHFFHEIPRELSQIFFMFIVLTKWIIS